MIRQNFCFCSTTIFRFFIKGNGYSFRVDISFPIVFPPFLKERILLTAFLLLEYIPFLKWLGIQDSKQKTTKIECLVMVERFLGVSGPRFLTTTFVGYIIKVLRRLQPPEILYASRIDWGLQC